jgi:hypothetical protein
MIIDGESYPWYNGLDHVVASLQQPSTSGFVAERAVLQPGDSINSDPNPLATQAARSMNRSLAPVPRVFLIPVDLGALGHVSAFRHGGTQNHGDVPGLEEVA